MKFGSCYDGVLWGASMTWYDGKLTVFGHAEAIRLPTIAKGARLGGWSSRTCTQCESATIQQMKVMAVFRRDLVRRCGSHPPLPQLPRTLPFDNQPHGFDGQSLAIASVVLSQHLQLCQDDHSLQGLSD